MDGIMGGQVLGESLGTLQIDTSVGLEKAWLDSSPVGCVKTVAE